MKNFLKNVFGEKPSKTTKIVIASVAVCALMMAVVLSNGFMAAGTAVSTINSLMTKVGDAFKAIYGGLLAIVSVLAAVIMGWCFILKMISKNPRSIDEANQWMKRTAIAWLCFMLISTFFRVGIDIVTDSGANTTTPWA